MRKKLGWIMFFIDKPYVSDFLKNTLVTNNLPVVKTDVVKELNLLEGTNFWDEKKTILKSSEKDLKVYCTSENSIGWISKNLKNTNIPAQIEVFKDKVKFRQLTKEMFPDFFFKAVKFEDFESIVFEELPSEFIIKPSIGFMSMGVYRVTCKDDWEKTKRAIKEEIDLAKDLYPIEVMNANEFIIEECIYGDEFALDVYFDSKGEPVVLNILKHFFLDENDVSDRVYTTSKEIILDNLKEFTNFAKDIGKLGHIKNFPVHVELRRDKNGLLLPIEVNPMRFGGWCTTADMAYMAYGFNSYLYYYEEKKPDWNEILKQMGDELYSIVVLDNSTRIQTKDIKSFDYDKVLSKFENVMELRKIDFSKYPVFGFLFVKTKKENIKELEIILASDLKEFINI